MGFQLQDIQNTLDNFVHKPELTLVYISFSMLAALNILTIIGLYNLRMSLVSWFLKNQIQHYRHFEETEYP